MYRRSLFLATPVFSSSGLYQDIAHKGVQAVLNEVYLDIEDLLAPYLKSLEETHPNIELLDIAQFVRSCYGKFWSSMIRSGKSFSAADMFQSVAFDTPVTHHHIAELMNDVDKFAGYSEKFGVVELPGRLLEEFETFFEPPTHLEYVSKIPAQSRFRLPGYVPIASFIDTEAHLISLGGSLLGQEPGSKAFYDLSQGLKVIPRPGTHVFITSHHFAAVGDDSVCHMFWGRSCKTTVARACQDINAFRRGSDELFVQFVDIIRSEQNPLRITGSTYYRLSFAAQDDTRAELCRVEVVDCLPSDFMDGPALSVMEIVRCTTNDTGAKRVADSTAKHARLAASWRAYGDEFTTHTLYDTTGVNLRRRQMLDTVRANAARWRPMITEVEARVPLDPWLLVFSLSIRRIAESPDWNTYDDVNSIMPYLRNLEVIDAVGIEALLRGGTPLPL
jgi:hypothetical protein